MGKIALDRARWHLSVLGKIDSMFEKEKEKKGSRMETLLHIVCMHVCMDCNNTPYDIERERERVGTIKQVLPLNARYTKVQLR